MAGGTKPAAADVDNAVATSAAGVHRFDFLNSLLKNLLSWLGALAGKDTLAPSDLAAGTANTLLGYGATGAGTAVTAGTGIQLAGGVLSSTVAASVPATRTVATSGSLAGGGDLSANRTLALVNDLATPGTTQLYGTDASGAKGWFPQPSGTGGGGITDAANDANYYLRHALGWTAGGGAALLNVGTAAGTVAAGNDGRLSDARSLLAGSTVPQHRFTEQVKTGSYTLAATDSGTQVVMNGPSAILTVPTAATLGVFGCRAVAQQAFTVDGPGTATVAVAAGSTVQILTANGTLYCSPAVAMTAI